MSLNLDANVIFDYYVSGKKIVEIQGEREVRNASRILSSYDLSPGKGGRGKGKFKSILSGVDERALVREIQDWIGAGNKGIDSLSNHLQQVDSSDTRLIKNIYIKNFKKIKELEVELAKITVLVGSNSSGKSSIMQAIQFMNGIVQSAASVHRNHQNWLSNNEDSYVTSIPVEKMIYSPSEDIYSIAHNGKLSRVAEDSIVLRMETDSGSKAEVNFSTTRERNLKATLSGKKLLTSIEEWSSHFTILSAGVSGISHSEQYKNEGILKKATLAGDANSVFRNVLYLLSRDDLKFSKFTNDLNTLYPDIELIVDFDEKIDTSIGVFLKEKLENGYRKFPVELAGTGLLQCIHILSYLNWFEPKIFILDEPDAHLNEYRQRKLADLLIEISSIRPELQMIVATHSPTLVDNFASNGAQVSWVINGEIRKYERGEEFTDIFNDLGALASIENVQNNNLRYLILTEDKKYDNLQTILNGNGLNSDDYEIIPFESKANFDRGLGMAIAATKENPDLRVLIHIDRDNSLSRDIDKMNRKAEKLGYTLFVTDFYELENYFTTFDHLKHVLAGKSITNAKIEDIIRRSLDSAREDSFDKLFNQKSNDHEFMKSVGDPASAYRKCEEIYNENELQYVKGKTLLGAISNILESEHGIRKSDLLKWSPSLENDTLKNYINEN